MRRHLTFGRQSCLPSPYVPDWVWHSWPRRRRNAAALHGAMIAAGVGDRVSIAIVQLVLLYASVAFLAVAIARVFQRRFAPVLAGLGLVALLPAAAWSGYWLTEAITTPVALALIACW